MRSEQQSRYCEVGSFRAHERDQRQTEVKSEKFLSAEWGRYYMEGMWINHTAQNTDAGRKSKNKSISTVMGLTSTGLLTDVWPFLHRTGCTSFCHLGFIMCGQRKWRIVKVVLEKFKNPLQSPKYHLPESQNQMPPLLFSPGPPPS